MSKARRERKLVKRFIQLLLETVNVELIKLSRRQK